MGQDRESGARANAFGHEAARVIAEKIGAVSVSDRSNEFAYEGRLITIRCARGKNFQVGISYEMLERVDSVVAAFDEAGVGYTLYEMTPALYKKHMRDSKGEGRIGLVQKGAFLKFGKVLSTV